VKEIVNRKDGTLTIEKLKPCKAERRKDMYYMLERMTELERLVEVGKNAEKNLKEMEEEFTKLCEMEIGEE
jgi:hypothetical protein